MKLSKFFSILVFSSTLATASIAVNPDRSLAEGVGFFCDETQNPPRMVAVGDGDRIEMITFTSAWAPPPFDPKIRCQVVSARFQSVLVRYGVDTLFDRLAFGYRNNQPVWCLARNLADKRQGICDPNEEIMLTFQNEWQGCTFLPVFTKAILQGTRNLTAQIENALAVLGESCNQNFTARVGRATPQERTSFVALNAFLINDSPSGNTAGQGSYTSNRSSVAANSTSDYILREEGELSPRSLRLETDNSAYETYTFEGRRGQRITVDLSSNEFDTYLLLLDASGQEVAENDDINDNNTNSYLEVTLPRDGVYQVIVNGYEQGHYGRYLLTIR